jgi:hypothetical protein
MEQNITTQQDIVNQYNTIISLLKSLAIAILQKEDATHIDLQEASDLLKQAASYKLHLKTLTEKH